MTSNELWAGFTHDPRDTAHRNLRASDRDRNVVHQVLAEAYADGRLDREEYDERSSSLDSVRTLGDLRPLMDDLVAASTSSGLVHRADGDLVQQAEAKYADNRRDAIMSFLGPSLITWAIWLATAWHDGGIDPYFPWPLIVMAATGMNLIRTLISREQITRSHVRSLEKKRAKELRGPAGSESSDEPGSEPDSA